MRERVELVHGDFIRTGAVTGRFDTVVLGDILDRVDDPGPMLDRCLEYLQPGGRVVVTTPLGLHPNEDHRRDLYLTDMIDLLRPRLGLEVLEIEDEHVRFAGRLSEGREASWERLDAQAVLSTTEAALAASQQRAQELERQMQGVERQARFDRLASDQLKIAKAQLQKLVDTKSGEVRVLRAPPPGDTFQHLVPGGFGVSAGREEAVHAMEAALPPPETVPLGIQTTGGLQWRS